MLRYTKALDSIKALRKDRVADLKAEKERLESLAREKTHADKLRARIADMQSNISSKEVDYEDTKQQYEDLVKSNAQFYNYSTKFREMYLKIENLQEKKKRYQDELEESKETVQEVEGRCQVFYDGGAVADIRCRPRNRRRACDASAKL